VRKGIWLRLHHLLYCCRAGFVESVACIEGLDSRGSRFGERRQETGDPMCSLPRSEIGLPLIERYEFSVRDRWIGSNRGRQSNLLTDKRWIRRRCDCDRRLRDAINETPTVLSTGFSEMAE